MNGTTDTFDDPAYLAPPSVPLRVLMVTDRNGCYSVVPRLTDDPSGTNPPERSLHAVVDALRHVPSWGNVTVIRAHRNSGTDWSATADLQNFRFSDESLRDIDQVWVFGIENTMNPLSAPEIAALERFVAAGKGLLGMGDHPPLGNSLCEHAPWIGSMRTYADGNPGMVGAGRLDTRIKPVGEDPAVFDVQILNEHERDELAQTIYPRLTGGTSSSFFFYNGYPHPLLCGPDGAIRVLPDHMHEGLCQVPSPLPPEFHGIEPEIIASGVNHALGTARPMFGLICVWDGAEANYGRVVAESTWHHFIWLNVQGFVNATTPEGRNAWRQISAYYRNLVFWLAPAAKRALLLQRALWWARWESRMDEELTAADPNSYLDLAYLGRIGFDVLGRRTSRCFTIDVLLILLRTVLPLEVMMLINPWKEPSGKDEVPLLDGREIYYAAIGGMLLALRDAFPSYDVKPKDVKALDKTLPKLLQSGAANGIKRFTESLRSSLSVVNDVAKLLAAGPK